MLRPALRSRAARVGHSRLGAGSRLGHGLIQGLIFIIILPLATWTLLLLGRFYQRSFIVYTEFLTGVPDWVTYRTSIFKFGGAAFAFVSYNATILILFAAVLRYFGHTPTAAVAVVAVGVTAAAAGTCGRALMRRAP